MTYYFFYGSIVEGARGILWWQGDGTDNSDYSNQRAIRAGFTNNRVFRSTSPTYTGGKDEDFLLKGDLITAAYFTTNPDFIRTGSDLNCSRFGKVLEKKFSALVYKYSGNYRVFLVNHEHAANTTGSFDFLFATDDFADWTNAVDNNGNIISLDEHPGNPNWKILSTTLYSNDYYRIYEIEDAVQDL